MRLTLRLILSLVLAVAAVSAFFSYVQVRQEKDRQREELDRRAHLIAESLQETVEPLLAKGSVSALTRLVEKFGDRERLAGMAVYDARQTLVAVTPSLAAALDAPPRTVDPALNEGVARGLFERLGDREFHAYAFPLAGRAGVLAVFHSTAFIRAHLSRLWRDTFFRVLAQTLLIAIVTLLIVRWSVVGPVARMAEWMKQLRAGEEPESISFQKQDLFAPIAREVTTFARHLAAAKAAAEEEARLRQSAESLWTPDRLKEHVRTKLGGRPLFVVSNREPYMHVRRGRQTECIVPAGGLVTALEPVLRACGGTWVAHGAGDADWDAVDGRNRLRVPPEDPLYTLRRVLLTKEVENGYYYGFANEGLWPLCHIAHTRPIFRIDDWKSYQEANATFADAVLEELADVTDPCVLIQDYHFALLPRLLKNRRPDARIALFWHIPWPNPEAFGICPWQRELLHGMLGADLMGFHTQYHCNNFLDTVDRSLETRIDWERFAVNRDGHPTLVKPFPISVSFPDTFPDAPPSAAAPPDRAALLKKVGVKGGRLGVGVERMDYTKGVIERFRAIERFLEKYPAYRGEFVFVQLGAPSREKIERYKTFLADVEMMAERVNAKFKERDYRPIVFLKKHHSHAEILPFYKAADLCMVTSLHDGMNLVAKEFVAARDDEGGALVLSRFTGAARELRDALIVNPYNIEQMADAIRYALEMPAEETVSRMRRLRETLREHNIYRWAGTLIEELTKVRLPAAPALKT